MDGTNLLVEKKHADNNWIFNDGKVSCTVFLNFLLIFHFINFNDDF